MRTELPNREIPVRCRVCERVRVDGVWWELFGEIQMETQGGLCPMCGVQREASLELGRKLADRNARAARRRGKKYGEAPEGVDPFRGFR